MGLGDYSVWGRDGKGPIRFLNHSAPLMVIMLTTLCIILFHISRITGMSYSRLGVGVLLILLIWYGTVQNFRLASAVKDDVAERDDGKSAQIR